MNFEIQGKYQGHRSGIYDLILYNKDSFLTCSGDGFVVKWPLYGNNFNGNVVAKVDSQVYSMILAEEELLVLGDMLGRIYWIDLISKKTIKSYAHHRKGTYALFKYNGYIFSGGGDGIVTKWDLNTQLPLESLQLSYQSIRDIEWLDNDVLLVSSSDKNIYTVEVSKMKSQIFSSNAHQSSVFTAIRMQNLVISGGRDAHIHFYKYPGQECIQKCPGHWYTVNDLVALDNQSLFASASRDKTIRVWDLDKMSPLFTIDMHKGGHVNSVNKLMCVQEENLLFSVSDDRTIIRTKLNV